MKWFRKKHFLFEVYGDCQTKEYSVTNAGLMAAAIFTVLVKLLFV